MTFKISSIQVSNFRNLAAKPIHFTSGINCIVGENGNGKSNILEAIHVLIAKKSFRKKCGFPQFLSMDGDDCEILFSSTFLDCEQNKNISYSGKINDSSSQWYFNGVPEKKRKIVPLVFINPFDAYEFNNSSRARREWFDLYLSLIDKEYSRNLKNYNKVLKFKNVLLKKKPHKMLEQIKVIDIEIAKYACSLINIKKQLLCELEPPFAQSFQEIFSEKHVLKFELESDFLNLNKQEILDVLQKSLEKDLLIGHSHRGPHRDDYLIYFDGINSFEYCSLGQQKMSYLSLLFAYIELFRYKLMSYPIVLIDDISGELDRDRWKKLVKYLESKSFQILITTANDEFKSELENLKDINILSVSSGQVYQH